MQEREVRSQSVNLLSSPVENPRLLSCKATTDRTSNSSDFNSANNRPELASQTRRESDPEITRFPSEVIATACTEAVCSIVERHSPVSRSQTFTVLSHEPDAAHF